jgi:hypothetical protein
MVKKEVPIAEETHLPHRILLGLARARYDANDGGAEAQLPPTSVHAEEVAAALMVKAAA